MKVVIWLEPAEVSVQRAAGQAIELIQRTVVAHGGRADDCMSWFGMQEVRGVFAGAHHVRLNLTVEVRHERVPDRPLIGVKAPRVLVP